MLNIARRSAFIIIVSVCSLAGTQTMRADKPVRTSTVVEASKATAAGVALPKGMAKDVQPTDVPEPTALFLAGFAGCMLLLLAQRLRTRPRRESGL